ncbi:MAG TPA: hypothetical protein VJP89_10825 [Pyrinomonadaceae bacterium]|nr:hypothetical protein [Pyrinomonadaceae bacterium]
MLNHNSGVDRDETPHANPNQQPNQNTPGFNRCIAIAYSRRAESVINDKSIDPQTRAMIRYALETSDPWLAELLRRVDAGESLVDTVDFSQEPKARNDDDLYVDKIEALAEMICRGGDEPDTKSAALLVLMAALENSPHPKALANTAKHYAFNQCAERNLCGMVEAEARVLEDQLFAGNVFIV